ncbi:MAG: uroporphyrinogen decarboxylase family protein [Planctomycetota bacterium]|jgi:uroporphyrinogen decarboxylase
MTEKSWWKGPVTAEPDFENVLRVLRREVPARPTLMELFMNGPVYRRAIGPERTAEIEARDDLPVDWLLRVYGFRALGYDYASVSASDFRLRKGQAESKATKSLNDGALITDRESFERYEWVEPEDFPSDRLEQVAPELPEGMKLIVIGPGGVLENVIGLCGYENLCLMIFDDPELVEELFAAVGRRLVRYYRDAVGYETVGAVWANDDWGFKTQTMLSPEDMRRYVIPWHAKIAEVAHAAGRPTVLHSCGCLKAVMDDIAEVIGHDGKHSYEDAIQPVEEAYEELVGRIAVIGGIDVDFVCRSTPEAVYRRSRAMLERAADRGGYALGTGNSVPEYVPDENYFAMLTAVWETR